MKNSGRMKKITCLCIFISCIGCTNNKQKGLVYYNDFETIKSWSDVLLEKKPVHSGIYSNRLDSVNFYGESFKLTFKEISDQVVKKVKINFWVYLHDSSSKGKLVVEINQPDKKNVFWIAKNIEDFDKKPSQWTEVTLEFTFVKKEIMLPENVIKIYPWNLSKKEMYIDDVRIEFVI